MSKLFIINLITYYSTLYHFDTKLALAVAKVESNYDQSVIGSHSEIGVFQINPRYYHDPKELKNIHVNIQTGIKMLKDAKENCKHKNQHDYLVCYNLGMTGGSKIKNPKKFEYVIKVTSEYRKLK